MKILIHENTLKIKEEDDSIINEYVSETFLIYPAEGKKLLNIITGAIIDSYVGVDNKSEINNYREV